jgi:hypothetical protein
MRPPVTALSISAYDRERGEEEEDGGFLKPICLLYRAVSIETIIAFPRDGLEITLLCDKEAIVVQLVTRLAVAHPRELLAATSRPARWRTSSAALVACSQIKGTIVRGRSWEAVPQDRFVYIWRLIDERGVEGQSKLHQSVPTAATLIPCYTLSFIGIQLQKRFVRCQEHLRARKCLFETLNNRLSLIRTEPVGVLLVLLVALRLVVGGPMA